MKTDLITYFYICQDLAAFKLFAMDLMHGAK